MQANTCPGDPSTLADMDAVALRKVSVKTQKRQAKAKAGKTYNPDRGGVN